MRRRTTSQRRKPLATETEIAPAGTEAAAGDAAARRARNRSRRRATEPGRDRVETVTVDEARRRAPAGSRSPAATHRTPPLARRTPRRLEEEHHEEGPRKSRMVAAGPAADRAPAPARRRGARDLGRAAGSPRCCRRACAGGRVADAGRGRGARPRSRRSGRGSTRGWAASRRASPTCRRPATSTLAIGAAVGDAETQARGEIAALQQTRRAARRRRRRASGSTGSTRRCRARRPSSPPSRSSSPAARGQRPAQRGGGAEDRRLPRRARRPARRDGHAAGQGERPGGPDRRGGGQRRPRRSRPRRPRSARSRPRRTPRSAPPRPAPTLALIRAAVASGQPFAEPLEQLAGQPGVTVPEGLRPRRPSGVADDGAAARQLPGRRARRDPRQHHGRRRRRRARPLARLPRGAGRQPVADAAGRAWRPTRCCRAWRTGCASDDLQGVLAEAAALPSEAAAAMSGWLDAARLRLGAEDGLAALDAAAPATN